MATASITLTSADIAGDPVNVSKIATLTKAGVVTSLDQTTGLANIILTTANAMTILPSEHTLGAGKAAKVYIANNSLLEDEFITVKIKAQIIGKLYAGQWMFFPWTQQDADADIIINASAAGKSMPIDYMLMHEGHAFA
tara:strand:+ start:413 stop:829 length:417 start_codon:yes stop_codon:yes gene_type:complete